MDKITNEQLCIAAQSGDKWAENALVENNLRFIRKTAYEIWSAQRELNVALGIELNDLVQEGSLGLLGLHKQLSTRLREQVFDLCCPGYS